VTDLLVVDITGRDGLVENRWVGPHAYDVLVAYQCAHVHRHQPVATHVVQPQCDAFLPTTDEGFSTGNGSGAEKVATGARCTRLAPNAV
jgi:hypothetical protein